MFRKAILIIHGFGGGVYDEEYLSTNLEFIKNLNTEQYRTIDKYIIGLKNIIFGFKNE